MAQIWWRSIFGLQPEEVNETHRLPVRVDEGLSDNDTLPPVAGRTVRSVRMVPGIGTGAAYAALDQFGTIIEFPNMVREERGTGLLHSAVYADLDDEGLQLDLLLFRRNVAAEVTSTDNNALVISDSALQDCLGVLQFTSFSDCNTGQVSWLSNVGLVLDLEGTSLWGQCQARGALNIAAGHIPRIALGVLVD